VQDKGLGDKISLKDAFDLAKNMDGEEEEEEVETVRDDRFETTQDENDETVHGSHSGTDQEEAWNNQEDNSETTQDNQPKAEHSDTAFNRRFDHPGSRGFRCTSDIGWASSEPSRVGSPALNDPSDYCESRGCVVEYCRCHMNYYDRFGEGKSRRRAPSPVPSVEGLWGADFQAPIETPERCGGCGHTVEHCRCDDDDDGNGLGGW
jgi:hypothetical protein